MTGSHASRAFGDPSIQTDPGTLLIHGQRPPGGHAENPGAVPSSRPEPIAPPSGRDDWYTSTKVVVEGLVAGLLLILASPVILAAGLLTRATSRGPAIYRQTRLGRLGRAFVIYKIRSMYEDCERETGPQWSRPGDSRLTPPGAFLRRTHIDELPQLINVLRGEMSLIGPRPERPEFVSKLEKSVPFYRERERIRPGVTGLAQVQLPPDTNVAEVHRKLACDLYYLRNQGPWLDLRILMGTATKVVGIPTRVSCRLLGIPSGEVVEESYRRLVSSAREWESRGAGEAESGEVELPSGWDHAAEAGPAALAWGN